jgi:hypothetical protein
MIYRMSDDQTVRVRTCNDHVLVTLAENPEKGAALNIEGTDHLLIVMPETPRSRGPVVAYFVPTKVAVLAVRKAHEEWMASNPNTGGQNRTWNIWFGDGGPSGANGFAQKWFQYRLSGSFDIDGSGRSKGLTGDRMKLSQVIANAKRQISVAAGVPESAIRITIDLS